MTQTVNQRTQRGNEQPVAPARNHMGIGRIEKAHNASHALTRLLPYLKPISTDVGACLRLCHPLYTCSACSAPI